MTMLGSPEIVAEKMSSDFGQLPPNPGTIDELLPRIRIS